MSEDPALLEAGLWFQPGPATLVRRRTGWVVLVPGAMKLLLEAAWAMLDAPPEPDSVLDLLAETAGYESTEALPAIMVGLVDGTDATLIVKGQDPIAVYDADGSRLIVGTAADPVTISTCSSVRRIAFGDLPVEQSHGGLRVHDGMARIRGFVHMTAEPAGLSEHEWAALLEQIEQDGRSIETPEEKAKRRNKPKQARSAPTEPAPTERSAPRDVGTAGTPANPAAPASPPPSPPVPALHPISTPFPAPAPRPTLSTPPVPAQRPTAPAVARSGAPAAAAPEQPAAPSVFDDLFADRAAPPEDEPGAGTSHAAEAKATGPEASSTSPAPDGRRRLVSTSLFDRRRSTPAEDAEQPQQHSTQLAPAPRAGLAAPVSEATLSVPTPDEEYDEDRAPVPQSSPIDEDDAPAPDAAGTYDVLFGPTVHRRIEDAAVRVNEEHDHEQPGPGTTVPGSVTSEPGPPAAEPGPAGGGWAEPGPAVGGWAVPGQAEPAPPVPSGPEAGRPPQEVPSADTASAMIGEDFIDWVPGVGRAAPEVAQTASRPRNYTGQPTTAPSAAVMLPGLLCPQGHPNAPERTMCRYCGGPLPGPVQHVERPPLGLIAISTGESFRLERSAVIGRRPRASRVSGHEVPQLITVPSPQQDISRSHLELLLEGWLVLAQDLGATNGTTLLRPGTDARRLRPHDGVVLYDGDELDLGDGISLRLREDG